MAKKRKPAPTRAPSKKQVSKWERERRLKRYVTIAGLAVIALIAVILGTGYYREEIAKYQIVVAKVNDKTFTSGEFAKAYALQLSQKQAMLQYWQSQTTTSAAADDQTKALAQFANQQISQISQDLVNLDQQVLNGMIQDEILRTQAASYGITVTQDDIQQSIKEQFNDVPKDGESPDDAAKREADFQTSYKQALSASGLTDQEFNKLVEADLLRQRMQQQLSGQVPTSGDQVHVYGILTPTMDDAQAAMDKIKNQNLDFAVVASQVSKDTASNLQGGDMGWVPQGVLDPAVETVAFSLNPGDMSDPIQTDKGVWIVKVTEKASNKTIDDNTLQKVKANVLDRWFTEQEKVIKVERNLTPDLSQWVYQDALKSAAKQAKQQRGG